MPIEDRRRINSKRVSSQRGHIPPAVRSGVDCDAMLRLPENLPTERIGKRHCFDCHDGSTKEGGLDLAALSRNLNDAETLRRWVRVFDRVELGEMPPKDVDRPNKDAQKSFLKSLSEALVTADRGQREVVHRRLNRVEYENTVRDLFQVRAEVAAMLPEDGHAHGFDNIGEALGASTELVEAYFRATDVVIDMVLATDKEPQRIKCHSSFTDALKTRFNAKQLFRIKDPSTKTCWLAIASCSEI